MLLHRFPHLLPHSAVLAHTVYQTVIFDNSIRDAGFEIFGTWNEVKKSRMKSAIGQEPSKREVGKSGKGKVEEEKGWKGLVEEVLRTEGWFDRWLEGEKRCKCKFVLVHFLPVH